MKSFYIILTIFLTLGICSCKTKKSVIETKEETKTETQVLVTENNSQKSLITETDKKRETKSEVDKSLIEAWMSFESDKITITDNQGNKTEITNPRINKISSQRKDVNQSNQIAIKKEKSAIAEENQQNNVAASNSRQIKTDLQQTESSKGKEPVWLYVVGAVLVAGFSYLILKRFSLIK